jgi:DNA polymerase-3 subunit beta
MKIIALKNKLVEALNAIERATGNNPSLPILKNVLVQARENKLSVSATNLEFAVTYLFSGKIVESGDVTVPCPLLLSLIKNLTSERVTLELKGKKLLILTENYEASLQSQEVREFPIIPRISDSVHNIETTTRSFSEALSGVISATQFSEIRPEISGVLVYREHGVYFVATDSFRLAERRFDSFKSESIEGVRAIVPLHTAEEALRIFSVLEDAPLTISFDQTQILFKTTEVEMISRLIDGKFPDYRAIIPKETKSEIVVERNEFIQALRLVSAFSTKINDVKIEVGEGKKHIEISSSNSSLGENIYKIPIKLKGDSFSITFNWRFLIDGLKSFSGDEITLGVNSGDRPALLRDHSDKTLLYVVMPLKV